MMLQLVLCLFWSQSLQCSNALLFVLQFVACTIINFPPLLQDLQELAALREQRLRDALSLYKFYNDADNLDIWFEEKEQFLITLEPTPDAEELAIVKQRFDGFEKEMKLTETKGKNWTVSPNSKLITCTDQPLACSDNLSLSVDFTINKILRGWRISTFGWKSSKLHCFCPVNALLSIAKIALNLVLRCVWDVCLFDGVFYEGSNIFPVFSYKLPPPVML